METQLSGKRIERAEPVTSDVEYGLFKSSERFLKKLSANDMISVQKDRYYFANALLATKNEKNGYIRGALVTQYILENIPVYLHDYNLFAATGRIPLKDIEDAEARNERKNTSFLSCSGHISLNLKKILKIGLTGVLNEIDEKLSEPGNENNSFLISTRTAIKAVRHYVDRYKILVSEKISSEQCDLRLDELKRIRNALKNVPDNPPSSLFEAIQALLIMHTVIRTVDKRNTSIGRLDFLLDEFYRKDIESSLIKKEEAAEWIQHIFLHSNEMTDIADSVQICGQTMSGKPFFNDISYFCLDAVLSIKLPNPQIGFRYTKGVPYDLCKKAFKLIGKSLGQPGFFNDEIAIKALGKGGFKKEHARDYVNCSCIELSSAGRSNIMSGFGYFNLAKPVEMILNNGSMIVRDNKYESLEKSFKNVDLDRVKTFADIKNLYKKFLKIMIKNIVAETNDIFKSKNKTQVFLPLSSVFIDGCIENGIHAELGGALYNQTFPAFTGLITAADSLAAIEKTVFTDKSITLSELSAACKNDFENDEKLRHYLLYQCQKYGNGNVDSDNIVKWIYDIVSDELSLYKNHFKEPYGPCYFGYVRFVDNGKLTGATPDGRKKGQPVTGTMGSDQGKDKNGITALFASVVNFDHTKSHGGIAVNASIDKSILKSDDGIKNTIELLLTYFSMGGMHIQFNCVDKDVLLDAQKHPENHQNLLVRVAGFTDRFISCSREIQNQIIDRMG